MSTLTISSHQMDDTRDVYIENSDMPDEMQNELVIKASELFDENPELNSFCLKLKEHLDKTYKPNWHVILGPYFCR